MSDGGTGSGSTSQTSFWSIIFAIFFGNFMAILSTTTINVAFPVFMKDFHAELNSVQWMIAGFMLATGVIAPIIGFLGDRWSYKRLYVIALAGFTLFSGLCTIAWNIESLIAFRIMQGVFSGIIMPTTMTIIYQVIGKEKQAFAMSLWSVSAMLAPAFGPTLGGWLTEYFGWKSLFFMNLPIGIIAIAVALRFIPHYRLSQGKSFDLPGFATVILSSTSLLVAFSQGNSWGWTSWKTIGLLAVGVVVLAYFIRRELRVKEPLLNLRVFSKSRFTFSLILNCVITISLYAGTFLIPIFMQDIQHASALDTALVLLPGSLVMAFCAPITGKLYDKVGPFWLILPGIALIGVSTWELSHIPMAATHLYVSGWMAFRYIGIALANMPVMNAGMSAIPRENSGHASSVTNWVRQGVGALSIGIFSSMLAARTLTHTKELGGTGPSAGGLVHEQALTFGIQDVFLAASIVVAVAVPLTFLIRDRRSASPAAAGRSL